MANPEYEQLYAEEKMKIIAMRKQCVENHVTPLLNLMGLPVGTVITREYDPTLEADYWEIQIGLDKKRGADIIALLKSIQL
jgi:hypothetical protein